MKYLVRFIKEKQRDLSREISKVITDNIFENRYTIHPSETTEISQKIVKIFLLFLETENSTAIKEIAYQHAEKGLSIKVILTIFEILQKTLIEQSRTREEVIQIIKTLTNLKNIYIPIYINTLESLILIQQEQLRQAMTNTISSQKTEILIKNQAIESSPNGIAITNLKGEISFINKTLKTIYDIDEKNPKSESTPSIEDLIGNNKFNEILSNIQDKTYWQGEITLNIGENQIKHILLSTSYIKNQEDKNIAIIFSFTDLTQQKNLEAQVRQAQKMEALGQLAGGISHDFNNILAAISGYAELELLDLEEGTQEYKDIVQIKLAAERGKELTRQLLFFTKRDRLKKTTLNLNDNIRETISILKRTFPREITIKTELARKLKSINANHSQINQVLMNLFVNSRDAIMGTQDENQVSSEIKRGLIKVTTLNTYFDPAKPPMFINAKPGEYVVLQVKDTGIGMPKEVIEHIFEPFYTTKKSEKGTGLGLSVVYGIVQNHGGFINIESEMGQGTTFEIFFPVANNPSDRDKPSTKESDIYKGEGTILIVEDEKQVRTMEKRILEKSGYNVLTVENGREAIELYRENSNNIDLIILDMIMPEMGGKECFYKLKEINPNAKIIVITGYKTDAIITGLIKEGISGIIEKPFNIHNFTKEVHNALSKTKNNQ